MNNRIAKRVAKGAALLDIKRPGWEKEVNIYSINMNSPYACILGQIYHNYAWGLDSLELESNWSAKRYGFELTGWQRRNFVSAQLNGQKIKDAWIDEINSRKSK